MLNLFVHGELVSYWMLQHGHEFPTDRRCFKGNNEAMSTGDLWQASTEWNVEAILRRF
jgi:hypothetical protein